MVAGRAQVRLLPMGSLSAYQPGSSDTLMLIWVKLMKIPLLFISI